MATLAVIIGIIGAAVLVAGAAWPEQKKEKSPLKSVKDLLLAGGAFIMLVYATVNYLNGGTVFYVFLQLLIVLAGILMMLNTDDRFDLAVISLAALLFSIWSLNLFTGYSTIIFIIGLTLLGLGYAFRSGTLRRYAALTAGSLIIAVFSLLESNWIFFVLNVFFTFFSAYYLFIKLFHRRRHAR